MGPLTPRQGDVLVGGVLVLLAAYVLWTAARMPMGSLSLPGAGFFPLGAAALLLLVGAAVVMRALLRPVEEEAAVPLGHAHIAVTVAALLGFALLLERAGFILSAAGFLFIVLWRISSHGWLASLALAVAAAGLAHLFFRELLGLYLPPGLLAGLL